LQSSISASDCQNDTFDVSDIERGISALKFGQSAGLDCLSKEPIVYAHPALVCHIKTLFNAVISHGFVPDVFGNGVTVPVPKDKCGDLHDVNNYRPITISPVISKLFEYCILHKFNDVFTFSDMQFGFRKGSGCSHAIFLLREVIDYFASHGIVLCIYGSFRCA